ncbi:MAG: hypothetical protein M3Y72_23830, partial [Acidobacteriota bacterium]|nr:hypothetical protein [Acidobacteriota bacterium]
MLGSVSSRTENVDRLVTNAADEFLGGSIPQTFAVLAVGGYGRRELFPFSDVDIILLLESEPDSGALKDPLSHFLRVLWDGSIKASQSVRTIAECCRLNESNIHLHISLLDTRFVCGDAQLYSKLSPRLADFYRRQGPKLLHHLSELTTERHASFGNTVYHLEPNVKEGPGGIRDIHFLHWAGLLAPDKEPLKQAAASVEDSRGFLHRVRSFLHEKTGRDNNLLSFELQDEAAALLPSKQLTPEEWMRIYYRHARVVYQSCLRTLEFMGLKDSSLLRGFLDRRGRLSTADFTVVHNRVFLRNPASVLSSLESVFDLFIFVARQGIPLSWDAQRRLCERLPALK